MKKYNKHYVKRNPADQRIMISGGKDVDGKIIGGEPVLGDIAKKDCPLEEHHVATLNRSWKKTGIFYAPMVYEPVEKSPERLEMEQQASELGIKFRENIGDDKLQEKINKAIEE